MRILPKLRTTAGSLRTSNRELIATWSLPRVMTYIEGRQKHAPQTVLDRGAFLRTSGRNASRAKVIGYVSWTTGVNCSILGYMSSGEMVPDVMTTLLNRSNMGLMASEGSRHLRRGTAISPLCMPTDSPQRAMSLT